ncbi:hypothetical protein JST97_23400 [bacterium]|nr:hypothetical protein [bacterium]
MTAGKDRATLSSPRTGQDWLIYHAWDEEHQGRQILIDPANWGSDGWPHLGGPSQGGPAPKT